ncbi:hypothetical protein BDV98DRAFT_586677 [Pterulicium gracile]|uniref:Uncharacterized protein n=1 Tax=Pterulicium gracile TaxID=1884261 RepID=A0A5C3Q4A2_9AGAR|nr:hypothetical protein BDV98DRAFT_586677 [Pterula gracilis]
MYGCQDLLFGQRPRRECLGSGGKCACASGDIWCGNAVKVAVPVEERDSERRQWEWWRAVEQAGMWARVNVGGRFKTFCRERCVVLGGIGVCGGGHRLSKRGSFDRLNVAWVFGISGADVRDCSDKFVAFNLSIRWLGRLVWERTESTEEDI